MKQRIITSLGCIKRAAVLTILHDGIEHAGYLAFLGLLAMFPFLVFVAAIVGFLGQGAAGGELITYVLSNLPRQVAAALEPRVLEILSGPPQGLLTVSILGAIWTASSAVEGIRTVLNRAYHVHTPPAYWFRRSLSIVQLLVITFIMIIAMLMVVIVPLILHHFEGRAATSFILRHQEQLRNGLLFLLPGAIFAAVAAIYYVIPNIRQHFVTVAPGALVVVLLWVGAAHLFTLYLLNFDQVNIVYGSLGGIIAALIFFYICNIIFIFGAELNHQIADALGLRAVEKE